MRQYTRDHFVIDYEAGPLVGRATLFRDSEDSNTALCEKLNIPQKLGWNVTRARQLIKQEDDLKQYIKPVAYRPFDDRLMFYHDSLVWRTVKQVMRHILAGENVVLLWTRPMSPNYEFSTIVTRHIVDQCAIGNKSAGAGISYAGPLYLYPTEGEMQLEGTHRRPNLNSEFIKTVSEKLGLNFVSDGKGNLERTLGPEDIFNYAYAIFHSPTYRSRYAEFLKMDFPRLPLTADRELFKALAEKGADLICLHLMESLLLNNFITKYPVDGSSMVNKVSYDDNNQRVYVNKAQYFEGIPPEIWHFQIGGYQVCQKWLKDRKGRTLTYDELNHYQKVVVVIKETIRLMAEIDNLIPGWPIE